MAEIFLTSPFMDQLDVAVLDYGLSTAQRFYLKDYGVLLNSCQKDGHVVILRFRDMARLLEEHPYEQAILSDSGDIIFQGSLLPLLQDHSNQFRAVMEDLKSGFSIFLSDDFFKKEDKRAIRRSLVGEDMITVVHNTGNWKFLRPIENFGYLNENMKLKQELMKLLKGIHSTSDSLYGIRDHVRLRLRDLRRDMKDFYRSSSDDVDQVFNSFVEQIQQIPQIDDILKDSEDHEKDS